MTLTSPPTGVFRITPEDGALDVFEIGRAPDFGNIQEHDLGQTVARSEGTKVYILGKAVETNVYRFTFHGLTSHEFHYFRLYVQDTLEGSKEEATIEWGRARNRILFSSVSASRNSDQFSGWTAAGASPPVVTDDLLAGPEGFAGTASQVAFSGSAGDSVLRCEGILSDFATGTGYLSVSFLAKVVTGGDYDIRIDSSAPGFFDATIPGDALWHRVSGSYTGWLGTHLDIQNNEAGARNIGLANVMAVWHPTRPIEPTFYDPAPLRTITNAKYVPDTFAGIQAQDGMWRVDALFREEVP